MQIGIVGLGRMGANMTLRLIRAGHQCVVFDLSPSSVAKLVEQSASGAESFKDLIQQLNPPRAIWLMVPAAAVGSAIQELLPLLEPGDTIIDGGNSFFADDMLRSAELQVIGIHYVDVGTSGGMWGLERGYCLMIGGEEAAVARLDPIFAALAPGEGIIPRTPGRIEQGSTEVQGYLHCGPSGAGHFVKMVHNGIEYGLMAAYAEGFNILRHANVGASNASADAETAPLANPERYRYDLNLPAIAELWRRGAVIGSWLLDLSATALVQDPSLSKFAGRVSDSGEGRWTIEAAIDQGVPVPVLSSALFERFSSRGNDDFANKLLSAMRYQFGGHAEKLP